MKRWLALLRPTNGIRLNDLGFVSSERDMKQNVGTLGMSNV
jgi:hypothetical protein